MKILGDDMDMIQPEHLGTCVKSVTSHQDTVLQVEEPSEEVLKRYRPIKTTDLLERKKR